MNHCPIDYKLLNRQTGSFCQQKIRLCSNSKWLTCMLFPWGGWGVGIEAHTIEENNVVTTRELLLATLNLQSSKKWNLKNMNPWILSNYGDILQMNMNTTQKQLSFNYQIFSVQFVSFFLQQLICIQKVIYSDFLLINKQ